MNQHNLHFPTIAVNTVNRIEFISQEDILYCLSQDGYTLIYINSRSDKNKLIVSKSLGSIFELLDENYFVRIHNSSVINIRYVVDYNGSQKNCITMEDGKVLPVSRYRKEELMQRFKLF